jgi:1-acyl-sn-glycerol-3-phosphate acyltransferase
MKTSSGKIRRTACRTLHEQGKLRQRPRSTSWQIARVWLAGLRPQWRRTRKATGDLLYAAYAYGCFGLVLLPALAALLVLPARRSRWVALSMASRSLLWMCRVPRVVQGRSNIPRDRRFVLVSNHASYLDGLVLLATLPDPVAFVAKAELKARPLARWFLGRIGAQYVERFDVEQGAADARQLSAFAGTGFPLCFFPEGTFTRQPGLLEFRMGAFAAAVQNDLPVVPVTIRGTRSILRSDDWFPRRGAVAVIIGDPIAASGRAPVWENVLSLRNQARASILRHLGEPDLARKHPIP